MSQALSRDIDATGDFAEMVELACVRADGDQVFIHRRIDIAHLEGSDCPCRPVVIASDDLRKPEDLLVEIERCNG